MKLSLVCVCLATLTIVASGDRPWYHSAIRSQPVQNANRVVRVDTRAHRQVAHIGSEAATNGWDLNSIIDSLATSPEGVSRMHGMLTQIQSIGDQVPVHHL